MNFARRRPKWTRAQIEMLRQSYGQVNIAELSKAIGRSPLAIRTKARDMLLQQPRVYKTVRDHTPKLEPDAEPECSSREDLRTAKNMREGSEKLRDLIREKLGLPEYVDAMAGNLPAGA